MTRLSIRASAALFAGSLLAIGGGLAVSALPAQAAPAQAAPAQAVAAETITTLPLFGAPLTVDVTTAPDGAISAVSVDPADGLTASTVKPNKVKFVNEDGTARVQVVARHGGERVQARAGTLADITGPGGWSGDVFGTGVTTTVGFEVAAAPDGTPDIVNITTSDATAEIGEVDHDIGDEAARAKVSILFTNGIEQRTLSIRVTAASSDDASSAKVSVALSDVSGRRLPAEQVVGAHTWNGMLCDGSAASITYTVNADGSISGVTAIPATASIDTRDDRARVEFSDDEQVRLRVRASEGGTELRVAVDERIRCERTDPTVNTPVDESLDGHDGADRRGGQQGDDDDQGGGRGDHRGGDDRNDDRDDD
jgi:hypothetical protein